MIKVQVLNGIDYRSVDPYRGTIEYIEDHLGNRYAFNSDNTTLDDVYALFDDPEFLNSMISKIPNSVNTITAQYLDVSGTKYDSTRTQITVDTVLSLSNDINSSLITTTKNYRTKFIDNTSPHSSWPISLMNSREGYFSQEEIQGDMLFQQIVTDASDVIVRLKKSNGSFGPWKSLFGGSNKDVTLGKWKIRENEDGSLGFFNKE